MMVLKGSLRMAGCRPDLGRCPDQVFTPELVDAAVRMPGAEQRRRLLPARLVMYFVLALWLFRAGTAGTAGDDQAGRRLYHQRAPVTCWPGSKLDPDGWIDAGQGRRWKPPNISSLSRAAQARPAPVRFSFEQVAGPIGEDGAPGVSCCGLRVVSIDGSTSDVPDSPANDEHFGRPSNQTRDGRSAGQVAGGGRVQTGACSGHRWPVPGQRAGAGPRPAGTRLLRAGDAGAGGPQVPVLALARSSSPPGRTSCGAPRRPSP